MKHGRKEAREAPSIGPVALQDLVDLETKVLKCPCLWGESQRGAGVRGKAQGRKGRMDGLSDLGRRIGAELGGQLMEDRALQGLRRVQCGILEHLTQAGQASEMNEPLQAVAALARALERRLASQGLEGRGQDSIKIDAI